MTQMSSLFASRMGAAAGPAASMMTELMGPTRRANPLENRELDRDARLYLLSKGLQPHGNALVDVIRATPGDAALIETMLKAGADPNRAAEGRLLCGSPLHCIASATARDTLDPSAARATIALLVRFGADLKQPNRYGAMPIHAAAMTCNWNALKVWLDAGYDVNLASEAGTTVLGYHAMNVEHCKQPSPDVIRQLVRAGADPDAGVRAPVIALVQAQSMLPAAIFESLLESGANANTADAKGNTALHLLVSQPLKNKAPCPPAQRDAGSCPRETVDERARLMRRFVARGADPSRADGSGRTALELARELQDEERRQAYVSALSARTQ